MYDQIRESVREPVIVGVRHHVTNIRVLCIVPHYGMKKADIVPHLKWFMWYNQISEDYMREDVHYFRNMLRYAICMKCFSTVKLAICAMERRCKMGESGQYVDIGLRVSVMYGNMGILMAIVSEFGLTGEYLKRGGNEFMTLACRYGKLKIAKYIAVVTYQNPLDLFRILVDSQVDNNVIIRWLESYVRQLALLYIIDASLILCNPLVGLFH